MTLLLPRAKSSQYLTLLLSALLALPSNLPTLERADGRTDLEPSTRAVGHSGAGPRLHRPDRKSCHHLAAWSVDVDEPEAPGSRDDSRYTPLALPYRPLDLPSLVPSSLDSRPIGPPWPTPSSSYKPPLRC
jgi:hypothetical protein